MIELTLTTGPAANGGSCVARHDGRVVFVRYALPRLELIPTTAQQREALQARKAAEAQLAAAGQQLPARKLMSTFFFIPMRAFPIIFAVIGILLLVINVPVALGEAGPNRL